MKRAKPAYFQASLTDTEKYKGYDLLKKGHTSTKIKKSVYGGKTKAKSISGNNMKNKLKLTASK